MTEDSVATQPAARPAVFSVPPYVGGESKLTGVNRVIKLSSNEGAFGVPPGAVDAIRRAAESGHRYPDGGATALRQAIGRCFDLDPERIVCGNGSDDLINLLIQSYGGPGTDLVMSAHGFLIYEIAAKLAGMEVRKAAERHDLTADVDAILALVGPETRLVFLANPNNPTGTLVPAAEMTRLRTSLPPEVLLVLDAAYAEYVDRPDYDPGIGLVDAGEGVVMVRTFSKIFGLGGLRLGWAYGPSSVIDVLNRVRMPFNVSGPAAAAGIAALAEPDWINRSREHNRQARAQMTNRLSAGGLTVYPSEANFVLVDLSTPERAGAADRYLRSRGIIVRNVAAYGLAQCLRVTIGTDQECAAVTDALTEFAAHNG
jgi:histidinol phosphate aminotransferase apoenzyme (EC 2.6.1.9)